MTVDYSEVAADVNEILAGPPVYLIETLAQQVAEAVLKYEAVQIVEVEVHKPDAPIDYEFKDVSMTIRRAREDLHDTSEGDKTSAETQARTIIDASAGAKHAPEDDDLTKPPRDEVRAIVAFGANMGTPWQTLGQAVIDLDNAPGVSITGISALFRTAPVLGVEQDPQDDYYNAVAEIRTSLSPLGLLAVVQQIEDDHGRVRHEHWGPRTLDLDIITYEGIRSDDPKLTLPHPRAHERAFVLEPWLQVDRNATVGRHGRVDVLARQVRDQEIENVADFWVESASQGIYPGEEQPQVDLIQPSERVHHAGLGAGETGRHARDAESQTSAPASRFSEASLHTSDPKSQTNESSPKATDTAVRTGDFVADSASRSSEGTESPLGAPRRSTKRRARHALPDWHRRKPQRIVDDADELYRIEPQPSVKEATQPRPRPRMERGLADDFATGLIPIVDEAPTRVSRRTIVRPTVTGSIPITRPDGREGETES